MSGSSGRQARLQRGSVHAVRVLLFAAILSLIHAQHEKLLIRQRADSLNHVPLAPVRAVFPDAHGLGRAESHGGRDVLSAGGDRLGYVVQTAPQSEQFIGFSGSTNVLIGFGLGERIRGLALLRSGDTRDHVELVERSRFLSQFVGRSWSEAATVDVDAVSGATLTSLAIVQGIRERVGSGRTSLKFPEPLSIAAARAFFASAETIKADAVNPALWHVLNASRGELGTVLRTSPAADDIMGYQGPSDAYLGMAPSGQVIKVLLNRSYDNEPYVNYVREDAYFRDLFNADRLPDLARLDLKKAGVEGVSGATMTSLAVARGLVKAAQAQLDLQSRQQEERAALIALSGRSVGTILVVVLAAVMGFTRLRGVKWFRVRFQLLLIGYLGLINGDLISQAMLVGWAQNGIPWRNAVGLVGLTAAALLVPLATKNNLYCNHVCPHGAAQQLLHNRLRGTWKPPRRLLRLLELIRPALLVWVLLVALGHWPFSLVDIEPFDAYLWRSAGWATGTIALAGLAASLFVPLAYCRYGCPTGALLEYVRFHRGSGRWRYRDSFAAACLILAATLLWRR